MFGHSNRYVIVVLICIFLMAEMSNIFSGAYFPSAYPSLWRDQIFCSFKKKLCYLFYYSVLRGLYIFWKVLYWICDLQISSPSVWVIFSSLKCLSRANVLNPDLVQFIIFSYYIWEVLLLPYKMFVIYFLLFLSESLTVLHLYLDLISILS